MAAVVLYLLSGGVNLRSLAPPGCGWLVRGTGLAAAPGRPFVRDSLALDDSQGQSRRKMSVRWDGEVGHEQRSFSKQFRGQG